MRSSFPNRFALAELSPGSVARDAHIFMLDAEQKLTILAEAQIPGDARLRPIRADEIRGPAKAIDLESIGGARSREAIWLIRFRLAEPTPHAIERKDRSRARLGSIESGDIVRKALASYASFRGPPLPPEDT